MREASARPFQLEGLRLPKALEGDPAGAALHAALRAQARALWPGSAVLVPHARWTPRLASALESAARAGQLVRGLEQAEKTLEREARGLSLVDARSGAPRGARVSRLLLVSDDGAERFYRQLERLVAQSGQRLLPIRVEADSACFADVVAEPSGVVRALMLGHKDLVVSVLRALYADP